MARWSPSKIVKLLSLYAAIFFILLLFVKFLNLFMPFLIAAFLAFVLAPIVDRIEGMGLSRTMAVITVYAGLGLILVGAVWMVSPYVEKQVAAFQREWPSYVVKVNHMLEGSVRDLKRLEAKNIAMRTMGLSRVMEGLLANKSAGSTAQFASFAASSVGGWLSVLLGWLGYLGLAPFLAFFFLRDGPSFKKSLIRMVPNRYFEMALLVHHEVDSQVRAYFKGQFLEAMLVGLLAWLGLWMIGLNYSFFVGAVAGVTNMIPYLGPLMGSIAGVTVALIDGLSFPLALKVIAVLMAVQFIDSAILSTFIVSRSVGMHPLLVVMALIVGGEFMGTWGMLLGVPILASTIVAMKVLARGFEAYRI